MTELGRALVPKRRRNTIGRALLIPGNPGRRADGSYNLLLWQAFMDKIGTVGHTDDQRRRGEHPAPMGVEVELKNARIRQAVAEAEQVELRNAVSRGEVIKKSDAARDVAKAFMEVKVALLKIPSSVAPMIIAKRDAAEAQALLEGEINDVLRLLSTPKIIGVDAMMAAVNPDGNGSAPPAKG
jgi:hypothetical protein